MSDTHTVQTIYGETEIETYDCDSCGQTVPYDETVEFTIGSRSGRACEMCETEGPISTPAKVLELSEPADVRRVDTYGLAPHLAFGWLFLPTVTLLGFTEESNQFHQGYATAVLTMILWVGSLALLCVML